LNGLWRIPILSGAAYPVSSVQWVFLTNPSKTFGQIVDGALGQSVWAQPASLTIDGQNNLYVIDYYEFFVGGTVLSGTCSATWNYALRRVDTTASFVSTIAGKMAIRNKNTPGVVKSMLCTTNLYSQASSFAYSDGNGTTAGLSRSTQSAVSAYLAVSSA
jgi:hypothetical protein